MLLLQIAPSPILSLFFVLVSSWSVPVIITVMSSVLVVRDFYIKSWRDDGAGSRISVQGHQDRQDSHPNKLRNWGARGNISVYVRGRERAWPLMCAWVCRCTVNMCVSLCVYLSVFVWVRVYTFVRRVCMLACTCLCPLSACLSLKSVVRFLSS